MSQVRVTVRGSHHSYHRAERGTVHAHVGADAPTPEPAYQQVASSLEVVTASVRTILDPVDGPVTWWAGQQLRTWAERPWNQDGVQLPLVHHARAELEVRFSDFAALSQWLSTNISTPGFSVDHVEWTLTTTRQQELQQGARTAAVRDAVDKAQAYADALGLGTVMVEEVADAGLLASARNSEGRGPVRFARAVATAATVMFAPEDIEVRVDVDAVFVAEG